MDFRPFLLICLLISTCSSQDYYLDDDYHEHILQREDHLDYFDNDNLTISNEHLDSFIHALALVGDLRKNSSDDEASQGFAEALDALSISESNSNASRRLGGSSQSSSELSISNRMFLIQLRAFVLQKLTTVHLMPHKGGAVKFLGKFGENCEPESSNPCEYGAYVRCMEGKGSNSKGQGKHMLSWTHTCACDFLHTQVESPPGKPPCVKNVWTQCTGTGTTEFSSFQSLLAS